MAQSWVAAILAGGESRRFGTDKARADLAGAPLIAHVARALAAPRLAVVGPRDVAATLGARALSDPADAPAGPLAGVLAALDWAAEEGADWLVTAPCDAPLLPASMPARLIAAAEAQGARAAHARTASGVHALCAAWRPEVAASLRARLGRGEHPPVRDAVEDALTIAFEDETAFLNVNTPDELRVAQRVLAER